MEAKSQADVVLLNRQREEAKKMADDAYNDFRSPHYRDNERFNWAINAINKKFDALIEDLKSLK